MTEVSQPFTNIKIVSANTTAPREGGAFNIIQPDNGGGPVEYDRLSDTYWTPVDPFFIEWQPGNNRWFYTFNNGGNTDLSVIGAWADGFRPDSVRVSMNSGGTPSGMFTVEFDDAGSNSIGSETFGFTSTNEDHTFDFPLDFTGTGDIAFLRLSFMIGSGDIAWYIDEITFVENG